MKKVNTFLHIFRHSLYPIDEYYKKVRAHTSFTFSFKYFISLMLVLNSLLVISLVTRFVTMYPPITIQEMFIEPLDRYPEDLMININRAGRMTSTFDRPYVMYTNRPKGNNRIIAVVDPLAKPADIKEYDAKLLLTDRTLTVAHDGIYSTFDYPEGKSFILDKDTARIISTRLHSFTRMYPISILLFITLGLALITLGTVVMKLILLVIISLVSFVLIKPFSTKPTLSKTYQIGLHAVTGPLLIEYTLLVLGWPFPLGIASGTWFIGVSTIFVLGALYEGYIVPKES